MWHCAWQNMAENKSTDREVDCSRSNKGAELICDTDNLSEKYIINLHVRSSELKSSQCSVRISQSE